MNISVFFLPLILGCPSEPGRAYICNRCQGQLGLRAGLMYGLCRVIQMEDCCKPDVTKRGVPYSLNQLFNQALSSISNIRDSFIYGPKYRTTPDYMTASLIN